MYTIYVLGNLIHLTNIIKHNIIYKTFQTKPFKQKTFKHTNFYSKY